MSACAIFVLAGCSRGGSSDGNLFQIPWPDSNGNYHLQNISITTFDHPDTLSGKYAQVYIHPYEVGGKLASDPPHARFIHTEKGVSIPEDYATLQGTAIQAHFERLVAIDQQLGLSISHGFTIPFKIAIQANLTSDGGAVTNNAVFDRDLDALMVAPYSAPQLPIAVNAGILAHEHFHMIFQSIVLDQLSSESSAQQTGLRQTGLGSHCDWSQLGAPGASTDDGAPGDDAGAPSVDGTAQEATPSSNEDVDKVTRYNAFYLRALNEGLADFWGWAYTGDSKFIARSLSTEIERRRIDVKVDQLQSAEVLDQIYVSGTRFGQVISQGRLVANAYKVGTDYARAFYELAFDAAHEDVSTLDKRMIAVQALAQALPDFAASVVRAEKKKRLSHQILFFRRSGNIGQNKLARRARDFVEWQRPSPVPRLFPN